MRTGYGDAGEGELYKPRNLKHRQDIDDALHLQPFHQTSSCDYFFSFDFLRKLITWMKPSGEARSPSLGSPTPVWPPVFIHRLLCTLELSAASKANAWAGRDLTRGRKSGNSHRNERLGFLFLSLSRFLVLRWAKEPDLFLTNVSAL